MNEPTLHVLGCDRSDAHLDFTLMGSDLPTESFRLPARAAALELWLGQWRKRFPTHALCVCFELPATNLVVWFSPHAAVRLYPVNPATLKSYRETFVTSWAKDDRSDSFWLADLVHTHRAQLPSWAPQSPAIRELTRLVEQRRALVDARTMWSNRVQSLLKDYFPEALELIGEHVATTLAIAFLRRWPTLGKLQAARWSTIEAFYRSHRSGRTDTLARRHEVIRTARPLTEDPAVLGPAELYLHALLAQLEPLLATLESYDERIAQVFGAHPDQALIRSFPGVGPVLAPRLLAALGDDRARFPDARSLQCLSGIAPVVIRSGHSTQICRRHACPTFLRQSFHEHASESIRHSRWARAYYEQQKQRGKRHHTIARALAFKWQRILVRCWQDHQPYDEARYLASLEHRNPTLYQLALHTRLPSDKVPA